MCGSEQRAALAAVLIAAVFCGSADAAEDVLLGPQPIARSSNWYSTVVDHLCDDFEYLACLEVSAGQCRQDLARPEPSQCGQQAYIVRDFSDDAAAAATSIPPALVECTLTAHVQVRGRDQAEVNRCLTEAKLWQ